ncbi:uncharacterized protein LOC115769858 isoform X1 [Drosophila novamexicana]|uniref:uncharacterized protein LOC115769858 isoform X1 n=1 Tax=Drosophila novamexicana TaxID=47314 RepID=UPI0011E59433|nr:uncharacterized protein LOC115769858 isoform X1 [Drosophila novamexicana]
MVFVMLRYPSHLFASKNSFIKFSSREYSGSDESQKSVFADIKTAPPIEVFHLTKLYMEDKHEKKVNLGIGAYRTEENKPLVLPVVKKCELEIIKDPNMTHEYLPILGNAEFTKAATELILGKDCKAIEENRIVAAQTISGTGALRVAAEFMSQVMKRRTCYMPQPTWDNHFGVFKAAGFKHLKHYPYWNAKKHKIDISKLLAALSEAPEGAIVVFQAAAHNPTGMDPTKKQWKQIAEVIKQRKLFPLFDVAYQGFASGDPDRDAWAVRYFVKEGIETIIAQSFSKSMGLYNERIGNLVVVLKDAKHAKAVTSQITNLIRNNYSNPPAFGSRIVAKLLTSEENKHIWLQHLSEMSDRVKTMRRELAERLTELETPGTWDHIVKQRGMFSMLGLQPEQCEKLIRDKHIYLLRSGRINICGLNSKNLEYVAESISEVIKDASCAAAGGDNNNEANGSVAKENSEKDVNKEIISSTEIDNKIEASGSCDKYNKEEASDSNDKNDIKETIGLSDKDCNKQVFASNDKDITEKSIGSTDKDITEDSIGSSDKMNTMEAIGSEDKACTKEIIASADKDNTMEAIESVDNDCPKQVIGLTDNDFTTKSTGSANKECTKDITGLTDKDNTKETIGSADKDCTIPVFSSADQDCTIEITGLSDMDCTKEITGSTNTDCSEDIIGSIDKAITEEMDSTKDIIGAVEKDKEEIGSSDKDITNEIIGLIDKDNREKIGLTDKDCTKDIIGAVEKEKEKICSSDNDITNDIIGSIDKDNKETIGLTDKDCTKDIIGSIENDKTIGSSDKDITNEFIGSIDRDNKTIGLTDKDCTKDIIGSIDNDKESIASRDKGITKEIIGSIDKENENAIGSTDKTCTEITGSSDKEIIDASDKDNNMRTCSSSENTANLESNKGIKSDD